MNQYHNVQVVAFTKGIIEDMDTVEKVVGYTARVSNPDNQKNFHTMSSLLKYCFRKKHFSVFDMGNVLIEINTSRTISRQILRHSSIRPQEFSQRYATVMPEVVMSECRVQDTKNRQNSFVTDDVELQEWWANAQLQVHEFTTEKYQQAIDKGIAKEQARNLLSEGLTPTRMYMNGTIRSWITFCLVRCGIETQAEHRHIAKEICKLLLDHVPSLGGLLAKCLEDDYKAEQEDLTLILEMAVQSGDERGEIVRLIEKAVPSVTGLL
ncbi:thymidylate synthase [Vibrio phage vB_VpaS_KF4]|nr:thymidylate synthase [Vibrio phage vB_VpaS_KF3]ATI19279.1 thymidylate synthase [Vibrio phage vB_VpaS_KF4]